MRTTTTNGITLQYPDGLAFAFLPTRLIFTGDDLSAVNISMTNEGTVQDAQFSAIGGELYCDVRAYLQGFFDGVRFGDVDYGQPAERTELGKVVTFSVSALSASGVSTTFGFDVFVVWGALRFGETYNGVQSLTYFTGYPFTVGVYAGEAGVISVRGNGGSFSQCEIGAQGVYNIVVDDVNGSKAKVYAIGDLIQRATFDKTFDFTFFKAPSALQTLVAKIDVVDAVYKHPYYLRWIDRAGFYRYWLFESNDDYTTKASASGDYTRNDLLSYDDKLHGYKSHGGRMQYYEREDSIPLCAPMVDSETYDRLLDLCTSPVVDLYRGVDGDGVAMWQPVVMTAGSYTKSEDELQDFICNVTLQEVPLQKL